MRRESIQRPFHIQARNFSLIFLVWALSENSIHDEIIDVNLSNGTGMKMTSFQTIQSTREHFESIHGFWNEDLQNLLETDSEYFAAYNQLLQVSARRNTLCAKERELICVAVNAQVTYLNQAATGHHIRQALAAGASVAEVAETIQLAASLGTHSMLIGVPIAHEVFQELGIAAPVEDPSQDAYRETLKAQFIEDRKYWAPSWDTVLAYAPEYFEAYLSLSRIPWASGPLDERFKELVYIAIDVATTHLFESGIRTHIKKSVEYGASPEQIIDVMTLASNIGAHTSLMGITALAGERGAR